MHKKLIQIDLDGVLNNYSGIYNAEKIVDIKIGAKEFLEELSKNYDIEIFTVENKIKTVEWLKNNNLLEFISDVTNVKNQYASVIVDDRALNFDGNYQKTITKIRKFKPYWKN